MTTQNVDLATLTNEVDRARMQYELAKATLEAAQEAERDAKNIAALASDMNCPNPGYQGVAPYILPMGDSAPGGWNPLDPETSPFGQCWLANGSVVVLSKPERTRPTRTVFSSGAPRDDWKLGAIWDCRHDQTGARLGTYTVVGIVLYDGKGNVARVEGNVPNRRINGAVFK